MNYHHKMLLTVATSVLLLSNLSCAAPVLADNIPTNNQQSTVQKPITTTQDNVQVANKVDNQSATSIAKQISSGQLNDQQVVDHTYQKINEENSQLNNVIYQDPVNAQQQVQHLQQSSQNPEQDQKQDRPFYGTPILIKGLGQAYKSYPNTNGLPYLKGDTYGYTKNFVKKLQDMGFIIVGSTNYPELGLINVTDSNLYGVAHNPWNLDHNAGGSSGGAAASVAAGIVPIATGNDAGGSLRIPASWSGVIGLKPTQGIILGDSSIPSVVNFAETRNIDDTITLFKGLMNPRRTSLLKTTPANLRSLKIAYSLKSPVGTPVSKDAQQAILNAVKFLRQQGFTVVEQSSPVDGVKMMHGYYLGALTDGSVANFMANQKLHRNLTATDVTSHLVSPMTYALYEASRKAPRNTLQKYRAELELVNQQMTAFHKDYPIYLTPTTATVAPLNSDPSFLPYYVQKILKIKDLSFDQQMQLIYGAWLHGLSKTPFTQLANLSGEPALSLPTYVSAAGLPLGIQLEGSKGSDLTLLALGKLFEENHKLNFLNNYLATKPSGIATSTPKPRSTTTVSSSKKSLNFNTVENEIRPNVSVNGREVPSANQIEANVFTRPFSPIQSNNATATLQETYQAEQITKLSQSNSEKILPQTGNDNRMALVGLGLASVLISMLSLRRRHN